MARDLKWEINRGGNGITFRQNGNIACSIGNPVGNDPIVDIDVNSDETEVVILCESGRCWVNSINVYGCSDNTNKGPRTIYSPYSSAKIVRARWMGNDVRITLSDGNQFTKQVY